MAGGGPERVPAQRQLVLGSSESTRFSGARGHGHGHRMNTNDADDENEDRVQDLGASGGSGSARGSAYAATEVTASTNRSRRGSLSALKRSHGRNRARDMDSEDDEGPRDR